ncbi:MAG: transglycosylase domain-containing protein [Xanthomonadales bacterium]|nr:transglycosylase domain-containing protein [Xanthomonadales bacterium]
MPDREQSILMASNLRFVVDDDGESWRAIAPICADIEQLPPYAPELLVLAEDRRFYWHPGFDLIAIVRVIAGGSGGGSTISQQLARTLVGNDRSNSLMRKLRELAYALKLEWQFSKREVLQMYLNNVWFGSGAYGIESAAREYFGKRASDLTALEAAILIQSLPQPAVNWHSNPARSRERGERLLVAYEQAEGPLDARSRRISAGQLRRREIDSASLFDSIRREGFPVCGGRQLLVTTINPTAQIYAELALRRFVYRYRQHGAGNGALISLGRNNEVISMVPTVDRGISQYDHAMVARRSPGSAIKPLIYLAALQAGWRLDQSISALPFVDSATGWSPRNYNGRYPSRVSLLQGLTHSYNTAAVRLLQDVGMDAVRQLATDLHFEYEPMSDLGMALGAGTTTLKELVELHSVLAHGDDRGDAFLLWGAISMNTWTTCDWEQRSPTPRLTVSDQQQITRALRNVVVNGTARHAQAGALAVIGKTGTSDEYRDAWFIGSTGALTTGIWVGNDSNTSMRGVTGGDAPAEAFSNYMTNMNASGLANDE